MDLENKMKICPLCGKSTLEYVNSRHWVCGHCDFDLYNNVAAAVGLILYTEDNGVLLEKRAKEPQKGFLALPGGFIDGDESAESACVREVKEETGYDVILESIVPFGEIEEKRLSVHEPMVWHQISRLYFCDVYPEKGLCNYTENEKKHGFKQVLYTLDEALEKNRRMLEKEGKMGLYRYGYTLPAEYDRIFIPELLGWIKVMKNGVWGYVDENKERFGSLAEYYSHMADFFENQKYKYVMLPIEEEPFKIDLNTRSIEIPQSFAKCASVQSDQLAETIIFVVDRYFDYMDLANTHIYVQWTIPENKKTGVQEYNGATQIEMIDLETESGKIKFAWPLNDQITAVPGSVKFSVRFFRLDDSAPNKLLYSLNTTEKEIIIKEALQPTLTSEHNVESPISDNSFKKAILNSLFATEGVVPPV